MQSELIQALPSLILALLAFDLSSAKMQTRYGHSLIIPGDSGLFSCKIGSKIEKSPCGFWSQQIAITEFSPSSSELG